MTILRPNQGAGVAGPRYPDPHGTNRSNGRPGDADPSAPSRKVERKRSEQYLEAWTDGGACDDDRPPVQVPQ
jgi:hypothetical protein